MLGAVTLTDEGLIDLHCGRWPPTRIHVLGSDAHPAQAGRPPPF